MTNSKRRLATAALLTLWAGAAVGGMGAVMASMVRPDAPADAPTNANGNATADGRGHWPDGFWVRRVGGQPTLVVCLHPKCPCSEATLETVENLMPRYGGALTVHVLLAVPEGNRPDWTHSDLAERARKIPRLNVRIDPCGRACAKLGARTSGQAFLFDADGRLMFSGGLTPGRGEVGRTPGSERIMSVLAGQAVPEGVLHAPVFGCGLCRPPADDTAAADPVQEAR